MYEFRTRQVRRAIACLVLACVAATGCQPQGKQKQRPRDTQANRADLEFLVKGMEYLNRLDEFERSMALTQAKYQFDRWIDRQEPDSDWEPDPMAQRPPRAIRESGLLDAKQLRLWTYSLEDVQAIQEAFWLRDIARWVSQQRPNTRLKEWLETQEAVPDLERENLLIAELLFDWTIRNLQLETTLDYPEQTVAPGAGTSSGRRVVPAEQGVPGPGYRFPPWEALQYGYGDALQRSRVFIELGRQQGIDIVYLAFPGRSVPPRPRPWVTGVAIANELFLFDCELGLAIPGPEGVGIATLAQVVERPELLDVLDSSERDYSPPPEDLGEILALIDAAPTTLSQRMKLLEDNLAGADRAILTVNPTRMAERVKKLPGVAGATLWAVPYETIAFQAAMQKLLAANEQVAAAYYQMVGVFKVHGPLVQARHLHFRGAFEQEGERAGARHYYMNCRLPTATIDQLHDSPDVQKELGIVRDAREGELMWKTKLASARLLSTQSKQHSSYWLGLVQFDSGNPEAAIEWFKNRTLELYPDGPWTAGARYNLARCYEALGRYQEARELYLEDDSPQQHGNLIRAKLLAQRTREDNDAAEESARDESPDESSSEEASPALAEDETTESSD